MADMRSHLKDRPLFICYGGGHAASLAPVVHELAKRGLASSILGLTTAGDQLKRKNLQAIGMRHLLELVPEYISAPQIGATLAANMLKHRAIPDAETHAYLGVGFRDLQDSLGEDEARAIFARFGRQAFHPRPFFEKLFAETRPAVVVATNSPRSERAAIEAARAHNIPTLCLVDLYAAFEAEWCAQPGFADRVCVLNEAVAEHFRQKGATPSSLVVTGNPAFDRLSAIDVSSVRATVRRRLLLTEADRLLVWISQPEPAKHPFSEAVGNPELPQLIERELAAAFGQDSNVYIVMRLHPSEDRSPAVEGPRIRYGNSEELLDELLCAADCIVTCSSKVGLEAGLLGRPVVQAMRSIISPDLPLAEMGYATAASTPAELEAAIRVAFSEAPTSVPPQTLRLDAAERVSDEVAELLK